MPKGIRKACANCIKARLACDEGRPCQRCIVHQCDCVAVPRKPRVKKQKLDLEPPTETKPTHVDIVATNWAPNEFIQGAYSSFQLERMNANDESLFEGFNSPGLPSPTRLSPLIDSPPLNMSSPPQIQSTLNLSSSQIPSPPSSWAQNNKQLHASLLQQYANSPISMPLRNLQALQQVVQQPQSPQQQQQPSQSQQTQPLQTIQQTTPTQQLQSTLQALLQQPLAQQSQTSYPLYDASQMMTLLLDEKPSSLFTEWQDAQLGNYIDGQQVMSYSNDAPLKKGGHVHMSSLPQAKNSTTLFPSPIAIFDKQKFQLLDANEAMANFVGHNTVAELSTVISNMDDLMDSESAHIAKNAITNFVINPSPCFRICDIRTRGGQSKTVEFHVDITEQLLIFSVKSVFDTGSMSLPDSPAAATAPAVTKKDVTQMCNCKACEFLSPID